MAALKTARINRAGDSRVVDGSKACKRWAAAGDRTCSVDPGHPSLGGASCFESVSRTLTYVVFLLDRNQANHEVHVCHSMLPAAVCG